MGFYQTTAFLKSSRSALVAHSIEPHCVDKDEKVLNLESSGSLIMPAGEMEGMGREEAEAAN